MGYIMKKDASQTMVPFTKKYGVGVKRIQAQVIRFGGHPYSNRLCLRIKFREMIFDSFKKCLVGKNLRDRIKRGLLFFWKLRTYKGKRNMIRLPSRGQRTHTNAKTKRKFKF